MFYFQNDKKFSRNPIGRTSICVWYKWYTVLLSTAIHLQQITSWMTANLLTLNSSKTEFLLIGLKQQLCKNTGLLSRPDCQELT